MCLCACVCACTCGVPANGCGFECVDVKTQCPVQVQRFHEAKVCSSKTTERTDFVRLGSEGTDSQTVEARLVCVCVCVCVSHRDESVEVECENSPDGEPGREPPDVLQKRLHLSKSQRN